ncbi:MAG: methyltransferase domain-containing protein [Methanobrevibacter millerae]|uniref:Methyltransferase-like protein 5 n=1 Tax=Methanobrevibacter millerae TaxID=230361 RepID=A0A8T3VRU9_9EURY|nr:methyltransferase domain-containing protein [Methanobrevibacter millerae]
MKKITRKKHLEMKIQSILPHPKPKVELEQYSTPSIIASDLLWNALSLGDIEDKNILDLGCGSGIFAIGSALIGAKSACGIDIDEDSINLAFENADKMGIENIDFIVDDVMDIGNDFDVDTIFQNPPFGSQKKAERGIDLKFVEKARELSPNALYSFHMASTEEFLIDYFQSLSFEITHIFRYSFPIPKIYDFHTKESQNVDVIVIRAIL